jgi:hypothetical protein
MVDGRLGQEPRNGSSVFEMNKCKEKEKTGAQRKQKIIRCLTARQERNRI